MDFKVGDTVLVIDEAFSGVIKSISQSIIAIETEDGFELDFNPKELLKINPKASLKSELFAEHSIDLVISEKEQPKRRQVPKVKPKERNLPAMEVDLHIHQLTNSTKQMSNHDMLTLQLDTAKRQLDFAIRKRIQKVVFIHGVGEGVLKLELEYLFSRYDNVKFYDADYQKYGLGATEVYIYQNVAS